MAKRSPPMPFDVGSVTLRTALAAMAASMAEPPRSRMSAPACEAETWLVATMPYCVVTTERPQERSCAETVHVMHRAANGAGVLLIKRADLRSRGAPTKGSTG